MFRKSLIIVAVLVAAGSANADGFSFGFSSHHGHSRGHVHVERRPLVRHYPRPVYRYRAYPPSQPVYGMPYPVYVRAPQPTYYVSAPAPAPVAPVVNNITTNVNVQGDANTVHVGATAAQGSPAYPASQEVIWQVGMQTGTTYDFKWVDPRTGRVMEIDVDHRSGIIEEIEED